MTLRIIMRKWEKKCKLWWIYQRFKTCGQSHRKSKTEGTSGQSLKIKFKLHSTRVILILRLVVSVCLGTFCTKLHSMIWDNKDHKHYSGFQWIEFNAYSSAKHFYGTDCSLNQRSGFLTSLVKLIKPCILHH